MLTRIGWPAIGVQITASPHAQLDLDRQQLAVREPPGEVRPVATAVV